MPHRQLVFNLGMREASSFENFVATGDVEIIALLRAAIADGGTGDFYIWGEPATGKTHLLEAACRYAAARRRRPIYLPLHEAGAAIDIPLLQTLDAVDVVCIDDVDAIAGRRDWETALFTLLDQLRARGGVAVVSGRRAPGGLGLAMPELVSRLARGPVYHLPGLGDDDKVRAMQLRARQRGFEIPDDVAFYIIRRYPRDAAAVFALVDRLDRASLAHRRRVTIPFVRSVADELRSPLRGSDADQ